MNFIIFSHRRSGTHLLIDTLINNFNLSKDYLNLDLLNKRHQDNISIEHFQRKISERQVFKSHALGNLKDYFDKKVYQDFLSSDILNQSKLIYIYRDGRDVLVSLYTYMQSFNPKIRDIPFSQFIKMENNFDSTTYDGEKNRIEFWKFHVNSWLAKKDVLFISFVELRYNYNKTVSKLGDYLNLTPRQPIKSVIKTDNKPLNKIKQLINNVKTTSVCFNDGKSGKHHKFFTKNDYDYFNQIAGETNKKIINHG